MFSFIYGNEVFEKSGLIRNLKLLFADLTKPSYVSFTSLSKTVTSLLGGIQS